MSWIEKDKSILFLTADMVFNSEKGKKLQEYTGDSSDYTGHGAIRFYYGIERYDGIDKECTDFSTPANFPDAITHAIKDGKMRGLGMDRGLLTLQAQDEYKKVEKQAQNKYDEAEMQACDGLALDKYYKADKQTLDERKAERQALDEYYKIEQQADDKYEKVREEAFWDLFAIPENRNPVWI